MKYVILLYAAGFIVNLINPAFYVEYLMLDIDMILHGQVWRLFTFLIQPMEDNILLMALLLYVYYSIGMTLERVWGTFRFNLFYFSGVLFNILASVSIYLYFYISYGVGFSFPISLSYLNLSMFLALALTFPDIQFLLFFLIPVKAKYFAAAYIALLGYDIFQAFRVSFDEGICVTIMIVVSMLNFLIYFLSTRKNRLSPRNLKRKYDFSRSYTQGMRESMTETKTPTGKIITRHKCAVCGRTERDDESLEFRFCSRCNGNYEYCQDHLFTHTHIE